MFAAASLADALPEALAGCPGRVASPIYNFAGSNVLARQIEAAAAADLFISADEAWMDRLEASARIVPGSRRTILSNRLVVIAHRGALPELGSLARLAGDDVAHLVLADPAGVPAGRYARALLEGVPVDGGTLWERLAPRLVPTADVRAALRLVEAQPGAAGIVYRTDLEAGDRVDVVFEPPVDAAPPIRYSAAAVDGRGDPRVAERLLDCLSRPAARAVFTQHGFLPPPGG